VKRVPGGQRWWSLAQARLTAQLCVSWAGCLHAAACQTAAGPARSQQARQTTACALLRSFVPRRSDFDWAGEDGRVVLPPFVAQRVKGYGVGAPITQVRPGLATRAAGYCWRAAAWRRSVRLLARVVACMCHWDGGGLAPRAPRCGARRNTTDSCGRPRGTRTEGGCVGHAAGTRCEHDRADLPSCDAGYLVPRARDHLQSLSPPKFFHLVVVDVIVNLSPDDVSAVRCGGLAGGGGAYGTYVVGIHVTHTLKPCAACAHSWPRAKHVRTAAAATCSIEQYSAKASAKWLACTKRWPWWARHRRPFAQKAST
jgi:hypothetical protein